MPLSCPSITPYKINCPFVHCPSILGNCPPPLGDNRCRFRVIAGSQFVGKYYRIQTAFFMSELWLILQNVENHLHHKVNELQLLIGV